MLYLIGLGLNSKGISLEGLEAITKCKNVYLENYTTDFPYSKNELEKVLRKKIIKLNREDVECDKLIREAKKEDIALLVYGNPLMATTHISLILDAEKQKIKTKVIHNSSVLDAVAETGLHLYKFGKIASMPDFKAESFIEIIKENKKINAHSLILVDIGMDFEKALEKLESLANKKKIKLEKIIACSQLGTKESKIFCRNINDLKHEKIKKPFCFIIPRKLHFIEEESLKRFV